MDNPLLRALEPRIPTMDEYYERALRGTRSDQPPPLAKEEADSMLKRVSDTGLGALHYVGGVLDKTFGGRAVRGALGGNARELLSIIPGSDLAGITDESTAVSGDQLLQNAGMLDPKAKDAGFEWRDLAGPALEIALDPATYLTLGTGSALTASGKAASKAGTLAKTAAGRIRSGQSGLAGLGLPFMEPAAVLGTGEGGAKVAEFLGKQADKVIYSGPGRIASRLFDPTVQGMTSKTAQQTMRARKGGQEAGKAAAHGDYLEAGKFLEAKGIDPNLNPAQIAELRQTLEGTWQGTPNPVFEELRDLKRARLVKAREEAASVGRYVPELADDSAEFFPRQLTEPSASGPVKPGKGKRAFNASSPHQLARQDLLRDIPGGTEAINRMVADPQIKKLLADMPNPLAADDYVRQTYLGMDTVQQARRHELHQLAAQRRVSRMGQAEQAEMAALDSRHAKGTQLREMVSDMDPAYHEAGGMFMNNPLTDYATYLQRHEKAQEGARAVHDLYARGALRAEGEGVGALDALRKAGLSADPNQIEAAGAFEGAQSSLLNALKRQGVLPDAATVADLGRVKIDPSVVDDAMRLTKAMSPNEALNPLLSAWDSITNLTKTFQTSVFPSFHTRNMLTGLWQNAVIGASHPGAGGSLNPMNWFRPYADAMAMRGNKTVEGAAEIYKALHPGMSDADATRKLMEEMFQYDARVGLNATAGAEAIGKGTLDAPVPLKLPGTGGEKSVGAALNPMTAYNELAEQGVSKLGMANPLNVRGVGGREETTNLLARYGQEAGHVGDDLNRMSAFVALRRQGYSAEQAAAKARAAHYDYSKLTDFEREAMRRVIPFYNWTRQNLPFQMEQLATRPGGLTASAIKASDGLRDTQGFLPDFISEGAAIPVGGEGADGNQRFLTHLGLPFEDAFNMVGTGGKPAQRTLEKVLGMTNPLIKGPLEYLSGKQFYSGRNLDDLYSVTGNDLAEQALMNSPLSRAMTTGRQMLDERKSPLDKLLGVVGPAKFTDVDTDKQRAIAGRDIIEDTLKGKAGVRTFENLYIKPEDLARMSPEDVQMYQLYRYLEQQKLAQAKAAKVKK